MKKTGERYPTCTNSYVGKNQSGTEGVDEESRMHGGGGIIGLHDEPLNTHRRLDQYSDLLVLSENNILSLRLDQLRHIFDDLYRAWVIGVEKLGSKAV